jgi:4'-phosphopantetheinyl transferase EntD
MTAFDDLLPVGAAVVEAEPGTCWETGLMPEEALHVVRAIDKRRREFTAGRNCARLALAKIGIAPVAIDVGPAREPLFPAGVSGTITHTDGYCAAAVILRRDVMSIGIDADSAEPLPAEGADLILRPDERHALARQADLPLLADKLVFCIKEAFYKAYFQIEARYLDFQEASVTLQPQTRCFEIRVLKDDVGAGFRGRVFRGRYALDDVRLYAAVALLSEQ